MKEVNKRIKLMTTKHNPQFLRRFIEISFTKSKHKLLKLVVTETREGDTKCEANNTLSVSYQGMLLISSISKYLEKFANGTQVFRSSGNGVHIKHIKV